MSVAILLGAEGFVGRSPPYIPLRTLGGQGRLNPLKLVGIANGSKDKLGKRRGRFTINLVIIKETKEEGTGNATVIALSKNLREPFLYYY